MIGFLRPYTEAPLVSAYKFIETRHMVQIVERFAENRTNGLQHAFFNGVGYETWENIWNMFNLITPRDGEAIRRIATLLREFNDVVMGENVMWRPHVPGVRVPGVYASRFAVGARRLYLVVNRRPGAVNGPGLDIECTAGKPGLYFDVYHGYQFSSKEAVCGPGNVVTLHLRMEGAGYGAVLVVPASEPDLEPSTAYMQKMRGLTATNLASYSAVRKFLPQTIAPSLPTPVAEQREGMVEIVPPRAPGTYDFQCRGNIQQGDGLPTIVDVQFPFEASPRRNHQHAPSESWHTALFCRTFFLIEWGSFAVYVSTHAHAHTHTHGRMLRHVVKLNKYNTITEQAVHHDAPVPHGRVPSNQPRIQSLPRRLGVHASQGRHQLAQTLGLATNGLP